METSFCDRDIVKRLLLCSFIENCMLCYQIAKMNPMLLTFYCCIILCTITLMLIIIKYLGKKPIHHPFIRDHIGIDLAVFVCSGVCFMSFLFIAREVFGPFEHVALVVSVLLLQQVLKYLYSHDCFATFLMIA